MDIVNRLLFAVLVVFVVISSSPTVSGYSCKIIQNGYMACYDASRDCVGSTESGNVYCVQDGTGTWHCPSTPSHCCSQSKNLCY